jgi:hypothetical protein
MSTANVATFPLHAFGDITDRIFPQANPLSDVALWFFKAREGIMGPYESRETAEQRLLEFKAYCQRTGATGNRPPRS